ncbi:hypothetical protein [Chlorobium ferrooxidans]|uniref:Uncharacterized protein n=1 Tax=Chlorobium ferrooxidans DSM 13031 TaxID=377431 RepID=Q0YNX7_9CHLB|nr:hypothetical protein [Chlorobium ferrooxidans]EAT58002.1 hypothetical protein CferDRAFT_0007 [Chlorobium ferrooxidans DSM 13031]
MKIDIKTKDKNLLLRTEILDITLNIEQNIDLILVIYLTIDGEKRKGITNKSGGLSFKNKIDLLFDLEIFDEDEHRLFLLLMEFRNQFIHNIHCSSFFYAADILGDDKRKRLLKFSDIEGDEEQKLHNAYRNLYRKSLHIALNKIKIRKEFVKEKSTLLNNFNGKTLYFIDALVDLCEMFFEKYEPSDSDTIEVLNLKVDLHKTIAKEMDKVFSSEQYKHLQDRLEESLQPEKIKRHYK